MTPTLRSSYSCDKPFTRGAISYTNSSAKIVFYCLGTKSDCNCNRVFSVPVPCATVLAGAMNWLAWCWEVDLLSVQSHHQAIAAAPGGSLNLNFRKITNRRKQLLEMMFFSFTENFKIVYSFWQRILRVNIFLFTNKEFDLWNYLVQDGISLLVYPGTF